MSSPPRPKLPATLFRLTLAYAGLFVVATLLILLGGGEIGYRLQQARLQSSVERRIAELEAVHAARGMSGLADAVRAGELEAEETGLFYRLNASTGERVAGGLEADASGVGWFRFTPTGEDSDEVHSAYVARLSDGGELIVGFDPEPLYDLRELTFAGAFWTLVISLPLALICGAIVSARVVRRVKLISETAERVRAGSLSARVPATGVSDEFERLAGNVNTMLDSVEALTRNLENVTVGIAHDLRTPLTRVRNRLEALRDGARDPVLLDANVEAAIEDVRRLLATFDALLRIGQIDAGTQRAGFKVVDLSRLVSELTETYAVVATAENRALQSSIAPGVETLGDRALLTQMFANTLDNAIQHTPDEARIEVTLRRDDGGRPVATISDNGPGIPNEQHEEVLRPFRSFDRNGGRNHGLGLSIVHAIARLHGVDMRLEDNAPGLRVVFTFPPRA